MSNMSRRAFLKRSTVAAATAMLPIPKAMALVAPDSPPLRWFAVGHSDEWAYPMLAENIEQAISFYAHENGYTKGDYCPECDEISCTDHLDPSEWDDPLDHLEEYSCAPKEWLGVPVDRQPTLVEWLQAGFNVPCQECDLGELDECVERDGRALCWDCVHAMEGEMEANE